MGTKVFWALFGVCCVYDAYRPALMKREEPEGEVIPQRPNAPGVELVQDETSSSSSSTYSASDKSGFLSVDLCNSCGFRSKFDELRTFHSGHEVELEMPNVTVVGGDYPIATHWRLIGE